MTDEYIIERSEQAVEDQRKRGVEAIQKLAIPNHNLTPDQYLTDECDDCGDELPEFRKQKGLRLCVRCQTIKEKRGP